MEMIRMKTEKTPIKWQMIRTEDLRTMSIEELRREYLDGYSGQSNNKPKAKTGE